MAIDPTFAIAAIDQATRTPKIMTVLYPEKVLGNQTGNSRVRPAVASRFRCHSPLLALVLGIAFVVGAGGG